MKHTQTTYDKFVLVNLAFSAYSGLVTLDKNSMGNNIDPELYSAGELKTVSRDRLKIFGTLKGKARSCCLRFGTSFMGGYAIPIEKWKDVQDELIDIKAEYKEEATTFVERYTSYVKEWAEKYPNGGDLIIRKAHSADWIKDRFPANFFGCTLSPASGMEDAMSEHVDGMFESICKEIANDARQAVRAYQKGSKITNKMRSTFEGMLDKINALSFINSSLEALGITIKNHINGLLPENNKAKVEDDTQSKIAIILIAMSEPENLPNLSSILQAEVDLVNTVHQSSANNPVFQNSSATAPSLDFNEGNDSSHRGTENSGYNAGFMMM
jgi:hypothetical protein